MRGRRVRRACRVVRQVVAPNGKHRPRRLGETALEPIEARVDDIAWCPVEEKDTLHAFLATGGRQCWTCRVVTVDPAPPGGVE